MGKLGRFIFLVLASSLFAFAPSTAFAKKKQGEKVPVTIIKASDTQYKHSKLLQPKQKEKRFLWFKKKEAKVKKPEAKPQKKKKLPVKEKTKVMNPSEETVD